MGMNYKLTISEAAIYLGCSPTSLRRWEKQGKIQPERTVGGDRRYTPEMLDNLIKASKKN